MSWLVATFFGVGRLPSAPGTWGALATLPVAYVVFAAFGMTGIVVATVFATLGGWWATAKVAPSGEDPSEIVIDEVAGQLLALWPIFTGAQHLGLNPLQLWPGWIAAFLLFRLFDIAKPGPIRWADRMHTPLGVMLDDILAGFAAGLCVVLLAWAAHGLLGI